MRVESIQTLTGPNIYSYKPVLLMKLDLEELAGAESCAIAEFNERLLQLLPGLHKHHCARGHAGGFVERLNEGTYFGHIVEHIAIELSQLAGIPTNFGKTRSTGREGVYNVVVGYSAEHAMRHLVTAAVEIVEALRRGEEYPLAECIAEAKSIAVRTELGPSTAAIVAAATRRGIPCTRIGTDSMVQLGYGVNRRLIRAALTDRTSAIAVDIASDKELTKRMLADAAIPVPRGEVVRSEREACAALERIGPPVVVKPLDGRQGKGVSLNLETAEQVAEAFRIARRESEDVLVEELIAGRNCRVLVVDGAVVAASERLPAHVIGDGTSTIEELIARANSDPRRGEGHEKPLTKIVADPIVHAHLGKCGLTLTCVPPFGAIVPLREGINISTGGTARDITDIIHPDVARICERAARIIGLEICGIDIVMNDISRPLAHGEGAIIEVNASPGLRMHLHPAEGAARSVGDAIVDLLFPAGGNGRIPIVSITGTNGKTTVTRLIANMLMNTGLTVGMTTTDGIYINNECIQEGDTTGPQSSRTILSDPTVEAAVLETARGGIVRRGLGYDWSDIAVMTNIQPDHFGQDGIEDLEDLLYIKSLVAERVREGGTLVLNADDTHLSQLMEVDRLKRVKRNVIYFSLYHDHPLITRHVEQGGTAYVLDDAGTIIEMTKGASRPIIGAASIPLTMRGRAEYQIRNAMAAIAAARTYGIPIGRVAESLATFRSGSHNPGRSNLYRIPSSGAHVMLDYGHNPEAFKAICSMAANWRGRVTGVIAVPGDRDNGLVIESGRIAARGFHKLIVKEDADLRGRKRGEIATLLCHAVQEEVPDRECIGILDEHEAVAYAISRLRRDEIAVIFYEKLEPILEVLAAQGAVPVDAIEGLNGADRNGDHEAHTIVAVHEHRNGNGAGESFRNVARTGQTLDTHAHVMTTNGHSHSDHGRTRPSLNR
jgi:cyanophycin synthetase